MNITRRFYGISFFILLFTACSEPIETVAGYNAVNSSLEEPLGILAEKHVRFESKPYLIMFCKIEVKEDYFELRFALVGDKAMSMTAYEASKKPFGFFTFKGMLFGDSMNPFFQQNGSSMPLDSLLPKWTPPAKELSESFTPPPIVHEANMGVYQGNDSLLEFVAAGYFVVSP